MKNSWVISILCLFIFLGCSKKDEVKPSADSLLTTEAIAAMNAIGTAYQGKNKDILQKRVDPTAAGNIIKGPSFDEAVLSLTPRMVTIKASTVVVNTVWQGTWSVDRKTIKNRGIADFIFEGSPLKLIQVDGDNPFQTPLIE
jgi:hypothetical protein